MSITERPAWPDLLSVAAVAADAHAHGHVHVQNAVAEVWTINHPLDFTPNITVVDSAGSQVEGDVQYVSPGLITVTFSAAFAGTAYLS